MRRWQRQRLSAVTPMTSVAWRAAPSSTPMPGVPRPPVCRGEQRPGVRGRAETTPGVAVLGGRVEERGSLAAAAGSGKWKWLAAGGVSASGLCAPAPAWHPWPWGFSHRELPGPGGHRSCQRWRLGSGREGGNHGGILTGCQSKQTRGEVTSCLLPPPPRRPPQRGGRAAPRAPARSAWVTVGTGVPDNTGGHRRRGSRGERPSPSWLRLDTGAGRGVQSLAQPWCRLRRSGSPAPAPPAPFG